MKPKKKQNETAKQRLKRLVKINPGGLLKAVPKRNKKLKKTLKK